MKRRKRPRGCSRTVLPGYAPQGAPKVRPSGHSLRGWSGAMPPDESALCPPSHKVLDNVDQRHVKFLTYTFLLVID
jgi:hypothetical protein